MQFTGHIHYPTALCLGKKSGREVGCRVGSWLRTGQKIIRVSEIRNVPFFRSFSPYKRQSSFHFSLSVCMKVLTALDKWPNSGSLHLSQAVTFQIVTELLAGRPKDSVFDSA